MIDYYYKTIGELVEINVEANSIAESRRLISEINERENILMKLREEVRRDIRSLESNFLKEKARLRTKYSMKQNSGLASIIMGSPKKKLIKELKSLESKSNRDIEELKHIRCVIDDLLIQFNDLREPLNSSMRARFGN
ncbi:hypothetical protein Metbo_0441 [Methanobacterium lacus]|jgi:hypothetical protein|uniref:Uncharacterized protein n=1 Tax=Methanobacterium lacus (strain AL-21) TaxID=877455 RepID=F0T971_METLA|nr:hypothetical protein [Methanobacterium lacus]ADZ08693.1 hypothetical protein Metbo_0441 [Methanobacterium lacus]